MLPNPSLSYTQEQVLAQIAAGATATAAAQAAGIHRNTVANWLDDAEFRGALDRARADKALLFQDQAEALAAESIAILRAIAQNPAETTGSRIRAATAMLRHAAIFLKSPVECVHKNAQPPAHQQAETPAPAPTGSAKIGRNELCHCGSGIKFKKCCLDKPHPLPDVA